MASSEHYLDKEARRVRLLLADGREIKGRMFIRQGDRIVDLLNDTRDFLPFEDEESSIIVINKASIVGVFDDLNQQTGLRERVRDLSEDDAL